MRVTYALIVASGFYYMTGHGFDATNLDSIQPGMTVGEVEGLMDEALVLAPENRSGGYQADLSRRDKFCSITFFFDGDKRLVNYFHDH